MLKSMSSVQNVTFTNSCASRDNCISCSIVCTLHYNALRIASYISVNLTWHKPRFMQPPYRSWVMSTSIDYVDNRPLGQLTHSLGLFPEKNVWSQKIVTKEKQKREIFSQLQPKNPVNYQQLSNRVYNFCIHFLKTEQPAFVGAHRRPGS